MSNDVKGEYLTMEQWLECGGFDINIRRNDGTLKREFVVTKTHFSTGGRVKICASAHEESIEAAWKRLMQIEEGKT